MRSVLDNGGRIALASDAPLMWQDVFTRLEGAITRKDPSKDEEPLGINEAIDLAEAIKAMTLSSAYLMNQDDMVGSIETGKYADMIILDKNLFDIPAEEISSAKVLKTILAGRVVFDISIDPSDEDSIEEKHGMDLDLTGENGYRGCEHTLMAEQ